MINFINNTNKNQQVVTNNNSNDIKKPITPPTTKSDNIDKLDLSNKINTDKKKKIITYSSIAGGIGLFIIAIIKRKQIGEFFSKIFKKKTTPDTPDNNTSPRNIKDDPTAPPNNTEGKKPIQSTEIPNPNTKLPTLEEFTDLERRWNLTPNDDPMKKVLGKEKVSMRKAMIEGNVSFVPKPPQHFSSQEEKNQYILNALECTYINESSAMDALNVFDKFGSRFEYGYKNSENSISDLSIAVSYAAKELDPKTADKIFNKFIDLFGKFADTTPPRHNDTRKLDNIIIEHHEKMSEDTINKFIDTLEKLSFEQSTAWNIRKNIIENEYTKRSPEEITRIDSRLKKLEEKIKDLPFRDKSRHNG